MSAKGCLIVAAVGLVGCLLGRVSDRYGREDVRLTFLDVGQGDAVLVELPRGRTLLVDGGFSPRPLLEELGRRWILAPDRWVATHPDRDHAGGLVGLLLELGGRELWFPAAFREEPGLMQRLRALGRWRGLRERAVARPLREPFPGGTLTWYPVRGGGERNDRSLVLLLDFGPCRALFTGDIEAGGEAELAERLPPPEVDLLKVAHHGSRTSSTEGFLERARPRWAVISSGRGNTYGHPHPEVVERLRRGGTQVLRTDFHGFVEFRLKADGRARCRTAEGLCGWGRCRSGGF